MRAKERLHEADSSDDGLQLTVRGAKPPDRRACDNCFKGREKCSYSAGNIECDRCKRLGKTCVSNRPVRSAGRPRRRPLTLSQSIVAPNPTSCSLSPFGVLPARLQPTEERMMLIFIDPNNFASLYPAPRVGRQMHQQALTTLLGHFEVMHDGFFAMYEAMAAATMKPFPDYEFDSNIRRSTVALTKFRRMPCPREGDDLAPWLWLGNAVILHANFALGSNAFPLRRYMLSHLLRLGEAGRAFRSHAVVVSMVALDIFNCLLRGETPIMDFPDGDHMSIDPFFELCSSLINLLYELCHIVPHTANTSGDRVAGLLAGLGGRVQRWQPAVSRNLLEELTSLEAIHALCQTRVYKTMAVLFIHRLKHPFGSEDASASCMSRSILSDLDLASITSGTPPKWVAMPLLIASFETNDEGERQRLLDDALIYTGSASMKTQLTTLDFLKALWELRDSGLHFRWIDAISKLPEVFVGA